MPRMIRDLPHAADRPIGARAGPLLTFATTCNPPRRQQPLFIRADHIVAQIPRPCMKRSAYAALLRIWDAEPG